MLNPALMLLVLAIAHACMTLVIDRLKSSHTSSYDVQVNTIFVGVVAYKDHFWTKTIVDLLAKAECVHRVFVGVIEYVDQDTQVDKLPKRYRNQVRVLTLAANSAHNLTRARRLCVDHLYTDEDYVLFTKSASLVEHWDAILCACCTQRCVVTMPLSFEPNNLFVRIDGVEDLTLKIANDVLYTDTSQPVKALLWSSDFSFCDARYADDVLKDDTNTGVSAILYEEGVSCYHPGSFVAHRVTHPYGLREGTTCRVDEKRLHRYYKAIGVDMQKRTVSAKSRCGLSANYNAQEAIAKYGSIWQARVAVQRFDKHFV